MMLLLVLAAFEFATLVKLAFVFRRTITRCTGGGAGPAHAIALR